MGKGGDRVDSVFKKPVKAPKTLEKILVGVLSATPVSTGSNPVCASFIQKIFFWFFLFEIGFIITCIILQKSLYCQSTLSKSIRALEDEYKVILINRGAKKLNT